MDKLEEFVFFLNIICQFAIKNKYFLVCRNMAGAVRLLLWRMSVLCALFVRTTTITFILYNKNITASLFIYLGLQITKYIFSNYNEEWQRNK